MDWDLLATRSLAMSGLGIRRARLVHDRIANRPVSGRLEFVQELGQPEILIESVTRGFEAPNLRPWLLESAMSVVLGTDRSDVVRKALLDKIRRLKKPEYFPALLVLNVRDEPFREDISRALMEVSPEAFRLFDIYARAVGRLEIDLERQGTTADAVTNSLLRARPDKPGAALLPFAGLMGLTGSPDVLVGRGDLLEPRPSDFAHPRLIDRLGGGDASPKQSGTPIQRYTDVEFEGGKAPNEAVLSFALRVAPRKPTASPIDVYVPPGQPYTVLSVTARSTVFAVSPHAISIKVPVAEDSEVAEFNVRASEECEGAVLLFIHDSTRLIGTIELAIRARFVEMRLDLEQVGQEIFRDPSQSGRKPRLGTTLALSIDRDSERVQFDLLDSEVDEGRVAKPVTRPLGNSAEPFDAKSVSRVMSTFRSEVGTAADALDNFGSLGAKSPGEAVDNLNLIVEAMGTTIGMDFLSPEVRSHLASLGEGELVQLEIRDRVLDAIPWELAFDGKTQHYLGERFAVVRVPIGERIESEVALAFPSDVVQPQDSQGGGRRALYILGEQVFENVALAGRADSLRAVLPVVHPDDSITSNFDGGVGDWYTAARLRAAAKDSDLVYLLCHGVAEPDQTFIRLSSKTFGRLSTGIISAFQLERRRPLVFFNACSSASTAPDLTGFTSFGWSFIKAGAKAYVGTLAPVATEVALDVARIFFRLSWRDGKAAPQALQMVRAELKGNTDPTRLLYAVYGDPHDF